MPKTAAKRRHNGDRLPLWNDRAIIEDVKQVRAAGHETALKYGLLKHFAGAQRLRQ